MGIDNKRVSKEGTGRPGTCINKSRAGSLERGGMLNPSSYFFHEEAREDEKERENRDGKMEI